MKHVAAYLLAVLGGKAEPTKQDVSKIIEAAGAEVDSAKLDKLFAELKGKNLTEVLASGRSKLSAVPSSAPAAAAPVAAAAKSAAPAKEEPKKKEEPKEESDADMGMGMF